MLNDIKKMITHRPSFETSVGVVLFLMRERCPQFLLLQYPHGHWDFVKGHQEKEETEEETLRRELFEEAGIEDITLLPGFRQEVRFRYTAKGTEKEKRQEKGAGLYIWKKVIYFVAEVKEAKITLSDEHIDWSWLSYEDALRRITHVNSRQILKKAYNHIDKENKSTYTP